jgi:phage shock protein E
MEIVNKYWPLVMLTLWLSYRWWNSRKIATLLPELKKQGALFIDVRTSSEFAAARAPGTINIPLNELSKRLDEIPRASPVVLACASGTRSGIAKLALQKSGYRHVYNIGNWTKFSN